MLAKSKKSSVDQSIEDMKKIKFMLEDKFPKNARDVVAPYRASVGQAAVTGIDISSIITDKAASLMHDLYIYSKAISDVRSKGTATAVGGVDALTAASVIVALALEIGINGATFGPAIATDWKLAGLAVLGPTVLTTLMALAKNPAFFGLATAATFGWYVNTAQLASQTDFAQVLGGRNRVELSQISPELVKKLAAKEADEKATQQVIDNARAAIESSKKTDSDAATKITEAGGGASQINKATTFKRTTDQQNPVIEKNQALLNKIQQEVATLKIELKNAELVSPSHKQNADNAYYLILFANTIATILLGVATRNARSVHNEKLGEKRNSFDLAEQIRAIDDSREKRTAFAGNVLSGLQILFIAYHAEALLKNDASGKLTQYEAIQQAAQKANTVFGDLSKLSKTAADSFERMIDDDKKNAPAANSNETPAQPVVDVVTGRPALKAVKPSPGGKTIT